VAADALGARRIGNLAFEMLTAHQVHSVLVTESAIVQTRQRLWDELQLAAEPAGATAAAALLGGDYAPAPGERVAAIICGANTDPSDLVTHRDPAT
jgi:threonine dehydratase